MFTLAHISDIHLSPLPRSKRRYFFSKRILGYANWQKRRKFIHRRDILDCLTHDLKQRSPDHIAVTGDLTNLGLPEEFPRAAEWLRDLGPPEDVTVIPGNHDAYVRIHPDKGTGHWRPYMSANEDGEVFSPSTLNGSPLSGSSPSSLPRSGSQRSGFPFVRRFGDIAIVALSSAVPTLPLVAAGRVGDAQRKDLATVLDALAQHNLFRIVLVHHPPLQGQEGWQRGLRDAPALQRTLEAHGAELVLHGHQHKHSVIECETVSGTAIVVGVPSASEAKPGQEPTARYNEYRIERNGDGWRVDMTGRAVTSSVNIFECERRVLRSR